MMSGMRATRASQTRARLIAAGRALFAEQGFAAASTEQILVQAGTTRGGLYHHFTDKADLFAAVCEELHAEADLAITAAVAAAAGRGADAFATLAAGCDAWLDHMSTHEVRRILVIEAPTVVGWERWNAQDHRHGFDQLRAGIRAAQIEGRLPAIPTDDLAILLNGAMNYAVMMAREPDTAAQLTRTKVALHAVLAALRTQAESTPLPAPPS